MVVDTTCYQYMDMGSKRCIPVVSSPGQLIFVDMCSLSDVDISATNSVDIVVHEDTCDHTYTTSDALIDTAYSYGVKDTPVMKLTIWIVFLSMFIRTNGKDKLPFWSPKCILLGVAVLNGIPIVAAALTMSHGFRIASGVSSSASAIVVIPLRTLDEIPVAAYTVAYIIWAACFFMYLWLQLRTLPSGLDIRRKLYLFCVIMAAIHFSVAISQSSDTVLEGFTIYGPVILTACTYLMSLVFGGPEMPEVQVNTASVISVALGS